MTNQHGFLCEDLFRALLPEIGVPHKSQAWLTNSSEWFWWASSFEDHCPQIRTDCWITLADYGEVAVDLTVISSRNGKLLNRKVKEALARGVVPLVLESGMLLRARNGSQQALKELEEEVRFQIPLKLRMFTGPRMTRERAAAIKKQRKLCLSSA